MRYGATNPEKIVSKLMTELTSSECAGVSADTHSQGDTSEQYEPEAKPPYNHSTYRETTPGPRWTWERYGRTTTMLPDGRIVHIGGTHEMFCDPDFCIYNDVFVQHPEGRCTVYLYPKDDFPPTDLHTASLLGDEIILIGSCGYSDLREIGATQVMKWDTREFRITPLVTKGDGPGWISGHLAEKLDENRVLVLGGEVFTPEGFRPNRKIFELDVARLMWRIREHGDTAIFPVTSAEYDQFKAPRCGVTNPEEIDNPFWLEMARRQWPASRARLHFGDFARPKPELEPGDVDAVFSTRVPKLGTPEAETLLSQMRAAAERKRLRPSDSEIVWTAVRDEALNVALNDGRRLRIGGIIRHYSDEYADTRAYNDIIVMHSDGTIRILAYPEEVFPKLAQFIGMVRGDHVFIFGIKYRERGRKEPRVPVTLRLNTSTFAIDRIAASPPTWTLFYEGAEILDGDRALFPCYYLNQADAEYRVAFDLTTFEWSEPFPDPHHASGNNAPISRNY